MSKPNTVKCMLGMLGTDVHSKGIRTLARLLSEAGGIDVDYIGEHNSVEGMAAAVAERKSDVVGISFSSAAYVEYTRQLIEAMKAKGVGHVPVILGGIIHPDDVDELKEMGVAGVFGAGSKTQDIILFVQNAGVPSI
ncbi:cobalamin-dependent protein [Sphingobium sp. 3R8]|uniref:cobalamin B12-binding domain-containing protein n=1 Tax=Sphingobium sp. 3R8 TaxID=2874921 RepID=UPI001CCA7DFA|nr:cobalamin-dependent protein [Sphingobium sp. 3R8]MBZ9650108.1 cobalamin-dependent protein [Sphingobium sp. 3R8]